MILRTFVTQAAGVGTVSFLNRLLGLLTAVVLARWLGPEGYGSYAFIMGLMMLLLIPAQLGLPSLVLREIAAAEFDSTRGDPRMLLFRAAGLVVGLSVVTALVWLLLARLFVAPESSALRRAFTIAAVIVPALSLLTVCSFSLRALRRVVSAQILLELIPPALGLLLVLAAMRLPGQMPDLSIPLLARLAGTVLALFVGAALLLRIMPSSAPGACAVTPTWSGLIAAAFPFLLMSGVGTLMARTDVVMLGLLTDQRSVGIYNAALMGALLVPFALHVGNAVIAPEFSRLHAAKQVARLQAFAISSARIIGIFGLAFGGGLILFGEELLVLAFGTEFAAGETSFAILVAGQVLSLAFGSPGLMLSMTGHQKTAVWLLSSAACANVLLNAALIPLYGMLGAAMATTISLVGWKSLGAEYVKRRLGMNCKAFGRGKSVL